MHRHRLKGRARPGPRWIAAGAALLAPLAGCVAPADPPPPADEEVAEAPQATFGVCGDDLHPGPSGYNEYGWAYFGDLHLHTAYSLDAYTFGTRTTPAEAYLFAKGTGSVDIGQATTSPPGPTGVTLARPLDFLAITDHSEFLSVTHGCVYDPASAYYGEPQCELVRSIDAGDQSYVNRHDHQVQIANDLCGSSPFSAACAAEKRSAWRDIIDAAHGAHLDCHFTALVGYEWTDMWPVVDATTGSLTPVTNHRNVIFADENVPAEPLTAFAYPRPQDLWAGLDAECRDGVDGCDAITIPHNSNMSAGVSLQVWDPTPAGIERQQRYQVAVEVYQHKGSSECYYDGSAYSEAECQFEFYPGQTNPQAASYIRTGLELGIEEAADDPATGNPLQLGFVGATDDHNGAAGNVVEDAYVGHAGRHDDHALDRLQKSPTEGPGGITGVWAKENTRAEIYGAIKRRETFATSGPRIQVRFYQTTDAGACSDPLFPKAIVDANDAVPMGGTFDGARIGGAPPHFVIQVTPDPWPQSRVNGGMGAAGIASVQVIKAHAHDDGTGNIVVVEDPPSPVPGVTPSGGCFVWNDPTFNAAEHAFYYVRVLQEQTWRWSHHDCQAVKAAYPLTWATKVPGCTALGNLDRSVRERAWTSPIWYVP